MTASPAIASHDTRPPRPGTLALTPFRGHPGADDNLRSCVVRAEKIRQLAGR
jgi:hypothetical protein